MRSTAAATVFALAQHCPKCQCLARAQWIENRQSELLEVPYFHVVFTVPEEIAAIAFQNKRVVYGILFRTTAETLTTIAADPKHLGAQIGFFAVLHTWGQNLLFHPHLHCVVPGGGPSPDGQRWVSCLPGFFLPVRVLSRLFRRLFLEALQKAFDAGKLQFFGALEQLRERSSFIRQLNRAKESEWVVYAKRPFAGSQQVLDYVGRYTHRVAISNNRLLDIENDEVRFRWKDYRHGDKVKTMTLSADEFIRRFLLHMLPNRFQRIRYYGFLGNRHRQENLDHCRRLLAMQTANPNNPITSRAGLPRSLRRSNRLFTAAVSAMPARTDDARRDTAELSRYVPGSHRLLMIRWHRVPTSAFTQLVSPAQSGSVARMHRFTRLWSTSAAGHACSLSASPADPPSRPAHITPSPGCFRPFGSFQRSVRHSIPIATVIGPRFSPIHL